MTEQEMLQDEVSGIKDEALRIFVQKIMDKVPSMFWSIPASSSGKYHQEQSRGEGGLVRHVLATLYFAREFFCCYSATDEEKDCVIAALIMHDIAKAIAEPHDIVGAQFIRYENKGDNSLIAQAIAGVRWHMGPWATGSTQCHRDERGDKRFPEDFSRVDQMVHLSDYAASRKRVNLTKLGVESCHVGDASVGGGTATSTNVETRSVA